MGDDEDESAVDICFRVPLLIRHIMSFLPTADLLTCCLVNHSWKFHGRFMLQTHRRCLVFIDTWKSCKNFKRFLQDLRGFQQPVPYNGITFGGRCGQCFDMNEEGSCLTKEDPYEMLSGKFSVKFLQFHQLSYGYCPFVLTFLQSVLSAADNDLEEISYNHLFPPLSTFTYPPFTELRPWNLRKLRVLWAQSLGWGWGARASTELADHFLQAAPNLEEYYPLYKYPYCEEYPYAFTEQFPAFPTKVKPETLKAFTFVSDGSGWDERFRGESTRLRRLYLPCPEELHTHPLILPRMMDILHQSHTSLTTLHVHQIVLNEISTLADCPPFPQLRRLGVHRYLPWTLRPVHNLMAQLEEQQEARGLFPRLRSLELRQGFFFAPPSCLREGRSRRYDVTREDVAPSHKSLEAEDDQDDRWRREGAGKLTALSSLMLMDNTVWDPQCIEFLSQRFSTLTELTLIDPTKHEHVWLSVIWSHCSTLIKLRIFSMGYLRSSSDPINFLPDAWTADFCGISREEATSIRSTFGPLEADKLHIVPMRPSILWLTELRELFVCHMGHAFLPPVVYHLTLNRMPQLRVFRACAQDYSMIDLNDRPLIYVPHQDTLQYKRWEEFYNWTLLEEN